MKKSEIVKEMQEIEALRRAELSKANPDPKKVLDLVGRVLKVQTKALNQGITTGFFDNSAMAEIGRKGGKASLKTMTKAQRIERAKKAVAAREKKRGK